MTTPAEVVSEERARAEALTDMYNSLLMDVIETMLADMISEPLIDVEFATITEPALDASALEAALLARLTGGTGIDASVEAAIWDRAREREAAVAQAQVDEATLQDEALGFDFPTGALQARLEAVGQEYHGKVSSINRDVAVKQADLEFQNINAATAALVQLYQVVSGLEVEHWRALISQNEATKNFVISAAKLNADILNANRGTRLDAAKIQAQVLAQLVAASIGRVQVSAGVKADTSMDVSYRYENQTLDSPPAITSV